MGQRCSSCGSSSIAAKTPLAAESGANVSVETVPAADDVELNDVNSDEQQAPAPASDEAAAAAEKDDAANQRKLFKTVLAPASGVEGGYSKEEAKIAKALLAKKAKGSAPATPVKTASGQAGPCDSVLEAVRRIKKYHDVGELGAKKLVVEVKAQFPELLEAGVKVGAKEVRDAIAALSEGGLDTPQQAPAPASDEAAEKDDEAIQRKLFKTVLAPASGVEGGYSKEEAKIAKALLAKKAKGSALAEFEADEAEYAAEDAAAVRFHAKDDGIVCQRNAYHDAFSLLERI